MARNTDFTKSVDLAVGKKMQEMRLAAGLSRNAVAEEVGITHQQLQKYENGTNRVSIGRLVAIAKVFDVPVSHFTDEFEPSPALPSLHRRMCIELSKNFMQIKDPKHQDAVNYLVRILRGK